MLMASFCARALQREVLPVPGGPEKKWWFCEEKQIGHKTLVCMDVHVLFLAIPIITAAPGSYMF